MVSVVAGLAATGTPARGVNNLFPRRSSLVGTNLWFATSEPKVPEQHAVPPAEGPSVEHYRAAERQGNKKKKTHTHTYNHIRTAQGSFFFFFF